MPSKQPTQKQKKIPMRQCLGCNQHVPKNELLRIVRSPDGEVSLDATGKKNGRGAYICKSLACLKKVRKNRRLEHNLSCGISSDVYDRMEEELSLMESPTESPMGVDDP